MSFQPVFSAQGRLGYLHILGLKPADHLRQAPVYDQRFAVWAEHETGRLQVAVEDAPAMPP